MLPAARCGSNESSLNSRRRHPALPARLTPLAGAQVVDHFNELGYDVMEMMMPLIGCNQAYQYGGPTPPPRAEPKPRAARRAPAANPLRLYPHSVQATRGRTSGSSGTNGWAIR